MIRRSTAGWQTPDVRRPFERLPRSRSPPSSLIMLLVAFPVHEFAHALAAYRLGDSTAAPAGPPDARPARPFRPAGRRCCSPSRCSRGVGIGWAKPTPYNPMNLRGGRWGEAIIAVAGPISNLVLAIAAAIPLRYINGDRDGRAVPRGRPAAVRHDQPAPDGVQPDPDPAARRVEGAVRVPRPPNRVAGPRRPSSSTGCSSSSARCSCRSSAATP